jgi:rubrerythrin
MKLYDYAKKTERHGHHFYRKMAEQTKNEGVRRIFDFMADEEEELMFKLEAFRSHYPEIGELDCHILNRMAIPFDHICDNGRCNLITSDLDAYELAIEAEQKVVRQYHEAAEKETHPRIKQLLAWMAKLEQQELNLIRQMHDFADAPNRSLEWGEFSNLDEFHNFGYYEDLREGKLQP